MRFFALIFEFPIPDGVFESLRPQYLVYITDSNASPACLSMASPPPAPQSGAQIHLQILRDLDLCASISLDLPSHDPAPVRVPQAVDAPYSP